MATKQTLRMQDYYRRKRWQLVKEFGGKCRYCEKKEGSLNIATGKERHLEFCHKVNHRISGMNRGSKARIDEVMKHPDWFWLGCHQCHQRYDTDHPLTEAEKAAMDAELEVPF